LDDCATDEDAAFESEFGFVVSVPGDSGDELMTGRHRFGAGVHEHETAGAIGVLRETASEAILAEESGLLIASDTGDGNRSVKNALGGVAINRTRGPDLGQNCSRCADGSEQFVIPRLAVQIEEHSAGSVAWIGDVEATICQIPDEPGIDGAEGEFATIGFFAGPGNMIEEPANFASGKVGIDDETGFVFYQFGLAGFFEIFTKIGRSSVLPDDGVVNRSAGFAIPNYGGFALVGDAESGDVFAGEFGFGENVAGDFELSSPNFARVVLNPAGLGEYLLEFFLGDGMDLAAGVEKDGAGTGRPLIEG
jgi:hypothetical protein